MFNFKKEGDPKHSRGFTLIELMVVIAIIAFILSIAVVNYQKTNQRARDGKRKADLEQIRSALELYRVDKGYYPPEDQTGWCAVLWGCDNPTWFSDVAGALISGGYLISLPQDPIYANTNKDYFYYHVSNSQYELYASLETDDNNSYDPRPGFSCACEDRYDYKLTNP